MTGKKKTRLEKTIFDDEFAQDRADRRAENEVDKKIASEEMKRCFDILIWQMEEPTAAVFLVPVDWRGLDLPTYPQLIKHPMDLGTVKTKLLRGEITSPSKFAELVRLVYKNSMKFNQAGSQIHDISKALLEKFEGNYEMLKQEKQTPQMLDYQVQQISQYAEMEAKIAEAEAKNKAVQDEINALKTQYTTQAEAQALKQQPHLRMLSFQVLYPRKPYSPEEKEALCQRIAALEDPTIIAGLLEVIGVKQSADSEVELDMESLDDDLLHKVADYLDDFNRPSASHSSSRNRNAYSYGDDDGDYIVETKKKKR